MCVLNLRQDSLEAHIGEVIVRHVKFCGDELLHKHVSLLLLLYLRPGFPFLGNLFQVNAHEDLVLLMSLHLGMMVVLDSTSELAIAICLFLVHV